MQLPCLPSPRTGARKGKIPQSHILPDEVQDQTQFWLQQQVLEERGTLKETVGDRMGACVRLSAGHYSEQQVVHSLLGLEPTSNPVVSTSTKVCCSGTRDSPAGSFRERKGFSLFCQTHLPVLGAFPNATLSSFQAPWAKPLRLAKKTQSPRQSGWFSVPGRQLDAGLAYSPGSVAHTAY